MNIYGSINEDIETIKQVKEKGFKLKFTPIYFETEYDTNKFYISVAVEYLGDLSVKTFSAYTTEALIREVGFFMIDLFYEKWD